MEIRKRGKRADGSTKYEARYYTPDGVRVAKTFRSKREAAQYLTKQRASALDGLHIDPRRGELKLSALAAEYEETWTDLEPKTRAGYQSILARHVLAEFGSKKLARISPRAVQLYVNDLGDQGYAPNTIRRIYGVLNQLMRLAVERRYIAVNPCDAVKLPKKRGRKREISITPLEHEQVRALVAAIDPHYRLAVLLDAYMGLRAGELWALRRDDVDLLRGTLRIDEALSEVTKAAAKDVPDAERLTDSLIVKGTKTDQTRTLRLPAFLKAELAEHLAQPLSGDDPRTFIFTTEDGSPVRHGNFYKRVYRPAVRDALSAGLVERFRFHDLRHTCAALAIETGAHPLQIKQLLGHEDIKTTLNIYGHLFPSTEEQLADALDAGYRSADRPATVVAIDRKS